MEHSEELKAAIRQTLLEIDPVITFVINDMPGWQYRGFKGHLLEMKDGWKFKIDSNPMALTTPSKTRISAIERLFKVRKEYQWDVDVFCNGTLITDEYLQTMKNIENG